MKKRIERQVFQSEKPGITATSHLALAAGRGSGYDGTLEVP
jgi:hypothetical protein